MTKSVSSFHRIEKIVFAEKGASFSCAGNLSERLLVDAEFFADGGYIVFQVDYLERFIEDANECGHNYDPKDMAQLEDDIKVAKERGDETVEYSIH
jgi:hypothetical protein